MVLGVLLLMVPASAGELGRCISADVPDAVVLPDGSTHAAGSLQVCLTSKESPVRGRHATSIDGKAVAAFQSELGMAEADALPGVAYFVFQRNDRTELVLLGYAANVSGKWRTYRLADDQASLVAFDALPLKAEAENEAVLLAAIGG
jgi:hypothetical protein